MSAYNGDSAGDPWPTQGLIEGLVEEVATAEKNNYSQAIYCLSVWTSFEADFFPFFCKSPVFFGTTLHLVAEFCSMFHKVSQQTTDRPKFTAK